MRVVAWITEAGWEACVDAVAGVPVADVTLLHVASEDVPQASRGALAGLLGRHPRDREVETRLTEGANAAGEALLDDAARRLERPDARRVVTAGRPEAVVIDAARDADLLVVARDTRHPGPRSFGHATRFVVDHAPCLLLLAWPGGGPSGPGPPPPHGSPPPGPPRPR
jgi:nucleotide-binding universal stress UspA family protein